MIVTRSVDMIPRRNDIGAVESLKFIRRRESWVAQEGDRFYKIIRGSNDAMHDFSDPSCIASAQREYGDMRFLHAIDAAACCPEHIDQACIVYPALSGPDMHELLTRHPESEQSMQGLRAAMQLLARLHRHSADSLPVKNYDLETFLRLGPRNSKRMRGRRRMLVVTGFEARNFRFDKHGGRWLFFDPHHLWRGFPEEDFARFMVSLLMIRGKRGGPRPWTGFDRFALLAIYEATAPAKLDRELLDYFVREQLAKRQFYAMRLARNLRKPGNILGVAYTRLYFQRLRRVLETWRF